jgi:alpha-L-rhamnosidase
MTTPPDMKEPGNREPHMLSFNHYAYGAVIDWVYRTVAGLAPDREAPGYRHVRFAPRPAVGIETAHARVDSAYGPVAIDWRIDADGPLRATVELPFGTTGTFDAPAGPASQVTIDGADAASPARLSPGRHAIRVTAPAIVDPRRAVVSR